jgi:hypothetical protein
MKSKKNRFILVLFLIATIVGSSRLYFYLTDDFRLSNISYSHTFQEAWEPPPLSPEEKHNLIHILSQPFSYLRKGSQSYVFESADGKYVLKFFKFKHLRPTWLMELLPAIPPFRQWKEAEAKRKEELLNRIFEGYRLAFTSNRDLTGLYYIHLNTNTNSELSHALEITDKLGMTRKIDLDTVPFILQQHVKTTREVIQEAIKSKDLAFAKQTVRKIIDLYIEEYQKGMYDTDLGLKTNTGFAGEKAIRLDAGKLTFDENMKISSISNQNLKAVLLKFLGWVHRSYPLEYREIASDMQNKINESCKEPFQLVEDEISTHL